MAYGRRSRRRISYRRGRSTGRRYSSRRRSSNRRRGRKSPRYPTFIRF